MSKQNDEPAFPSDYQSCGTHLGISLRDYLATKAMQGMLASGGAWAEQATAEDMASAAYVQADAMIAQRRK